MERSRPGPDVVGVVGGETLPSVQDFVIGFRAGALRASPRATVLVDYSGDFTVPPLCAAVARRQIARGAGVLFDVAGGCGIGTLRAAKAAGVWAIGVDEDRSALGPHILTSVLKRYDRGLATLMRQARDDRLVLGRTTELGLRAGAPGSAGSAPACRRGCAGSCSGTERASSRAASASRARGSCSPVKGPGRILLAAVAALRRRIVSGRLEVPGFSFP